jgi:hypothetical protein
MEAYELLSVQCMKERNMFTCLTVRGGLRRGDERAHIMSMDSPLKFSLKSHRFVTFFCRLFLLRVHV